MNGKKLGHEVTTTMWDEWLEEISSKFWDALQFTASEMRVRYKLREDAPIEVRVPPVRDERERKMLADNAVDLETRFPGMYVFDWSLWRFEHRPVRKFTYDEARRICDRVNLALTRVHARIMLLTDRSF